MAQDNVPRVPVAAPQSAGDSARGALSSPFSEAARLQARRGGAGNLFSGLATFMTEARDVLRKNDLERDRIKSVTAETEYLTRVDEQLAKLDPLAKDYQERVKEIHEGGKLSAIEKADLRTPEAKTEFEARLTRISAAGQITAAASRRGSLEAEALRVSDQSFDNTLARIRKDPDGYDAYLQQLQADQKRLNEGIGPDKVRARAVKFADNALIARIEGYAEKGNFAAARKILSNEAGNLTPDQNRSVLHLIEGRESKARADGERYAARQASLTETEIRAGGKIGPDGKTIPGSKAPTLMDIEDGYKRGIYTPETRLRLRSVLLATEAEGLVASEKGRIAMAHYNAGTLGAQDQDTVNRAYNEVVVGDVGKLDPSLPLDQRTLQMTEAFAAKGGAVPSNIRDRIESAERMGGESAEKAQAFLAQAAYLADRMQTAAPNANLKVGDRVQAVMTAVKQDGVSYEDAARRVAAQYPSDQKTIDDRKQNFKVLDKDTSWTNEISDEFQRGMIGRVFSGRVNIPPELANEAKRMAERNYTLTGDHERAKKMTIEQIKRDYEVSYVGGKPTVMKNAPERYLPPVARGFTPQEKSAVIDEQIAAGLLAANVKPDASGALPAWRLVPDDKTAADIRAGRPPSYQLLILDPTGHTYTDVPNKAGRSARYTVPATNEEVMQTTAGKSVLARTTEEERKARENEKRLQEPVRAP